MPPDAWGRVGTRVVAIDAVPYSRGGAGRQYTKTDVDRELLKAYSGFTIAAPGPSEPTDADGLLPAVATGNWGCGAFGGDPELKAVLQLLASSAAGRGVKYFAVGNAELCEGLATLCGALSATDMVPVELYELVLRYGREVYEQGGAGLLAWLEGQLAE